DKIYPNVDEWLSLIRNARYVVTNSFHGMVFSIIFNKPFVVIPLAGSFTRMNDRIFDTLSAVHLTERIYKNSLDILLDPLDIRAINDYLKQTGNDISLKFDYWLGA
ncbi:MAG: polysaccharide pyruvyl transferase family protein, partial [Rikenellaceae bacterium]|nr:polysaccharide pyruvyl transferase family protein [Rikenellaceae bacterium]